jgi:hypothetical protein
MTRSSDVREEVGERNRAWRRSQNQKKKKRWEKRIRNEWDGGSYKTVGYEDDEWVEEMAAHRAGTGTPCSCIMCGNPRRYFGEDHLQERRAKQIEEEY